MSLNVIRICASCTKINAGIEDLESFHRSVEEKLREKRPELDWQVEKSPCLKVCPLGKITMTVTFPQIGKKDRLTVSRAATLNCVVEEILSLLQTRR